MAETPGGKTRFQKGDPVWITIDQNIAATIIHERVFGIYLVLLVESQREVLCPSFLLIERKPGETGKKKKPKR